MEFKNKNALCTCCVLLLTVAITSVSYAELSSSYTINLDRNIGGLQVYKLTDSKGRTTYSSAVLNDFNNNDFVRVEEIGIATPPSAEYAEQARLRSSKLKKVAEELGTAREEREKIRAEKEKQRLEHLALINQSRPRVYERNIYVGYPYRLWRTYPRGGNHYSHKPTRFPAHHTQLPLPSSSFSSGLR